MPLSEFYAMARGRVESAQQKTTPYLTDQTHLRDNEFLELVWENGQIMMPGQSGRARKIPISDNFQSQPTKLRDKDLGTVTNSKTGKFGTLDSAFNDFATAMPSGEIVLRQDDDTVPWWNYPLVNSLQHDYYSESLPEVSGITVNEISAKNSFSSVDKRNSCNPTISGANRLPVHEGLRLEQVNGSNGSSLDIGESSKSGSGQFFPSSFHESQTLIPPIRSGVSGVISNNTSNTKCDNCGEAQSLADDLSSINIQKQDSGLPNPSSGIINFLHFSRPASLVRADLQNVGAMCGENNATAPIISNFAKPMFIDWIKSSRNEMGSHSQPNSVPPKVDLKLEVAKPLEEPHTGCREDSVKNDTLPNQVGASTSKRMPDAEKTLDPVVACSSVGSGNSAERASNDPTRNLKRKYRETDDSEGRSEDVDQEESIGVRKVATTGGGAGLKRSQAAEVHNLSERRRRDRINEKMRALQELIPNCNKVDKASMLDEAIEYLKTLQLQVQIMSMGAGLYMSPMMLPTGMQHMHAAHMAHFSPMAVGMGMGMNGGSPGWPTIQVPSMQGPHISASHSQPILGPTNLQGMGGSNLQVFGHPGQGLAISSPRAHLEPFSGGPPISLAMGLNANGPAAAVKVPSSAPTAYSKDSLETTDSQMVHNTDASSSMKQECSQSQQSTPVAADGSGEDVSMIKEKENLLITRPACCD